MGVWTEDREKGSVEESFQCFSFIERERETETETERVFPKVPI